MNYIYDIYLNFNKMYFDFYEWNSSDKIIHTKKVPIIKTNTNDFRAIISHNISIDEDILKILKGKTEIYNKKNKLNCLIITDSKNAFAVKFDNKGISISKSSLLLDDEFDIIQFSIKMKENNFPFKILNKTNYNVATRKQIDEKKYLLNHIHKLSYDTLKYIYYECFDKEEKNIQTILQHLIKEINNDNSAFNSTIYNILKPVSAN